MYETADDLILYAGLQDEHEPTGNRSNVHNTRRHAVKLGAMPVPEPSVESL